MKTVRCCFQIRQHLPGLSTGISSCQVPLHIHISRKTNHKGLNQEMQVRRKRCNLESPAAVVECSADVPVPCNAQHMSRQLHLKG